MQPIIQVEDLSKKYSLGEQQKYIALRDVLSGLLTNTFNKLGKAKENTDSEYYALKNINFDVYPGEIIGVIGRNGAGKSTLLKILSRITPPTGGSAAIFGRVGSLLEVGTGFHQELTGRENIFLNGAILGMSQREIKAKFNDIVEFAEIGKFIDTPVKHYSSGMYVRLAFSVAAQLEPEILLVDEVLAVGDAAFQKKCLGKMDDIAHKKGRTILFVSHNMNAINSLCNKAVWIENGELKMQGSASLVTEKYLSRALGSPARIRFRDKSGFPVQIKEISIYDIGGKLKNIIPLDREWKISVTYRVNQPVSGYHLSLNFYTALGTHLCSVADTDDNPELFSTRQPGEYTVNYICPPKTLNVGMYFVRVSAGIPRTVPTDQQVMEGITIVQENCSRVGELINTEVRGPMIMNGKWMLSIK